MEQRIIKVLDARVALQCNTRLIFAENYFSMTDVESLHSDYEQVQDLPADSPTDATILILDSPGTPEVVANGDLAVARGPFARMEEDMADKRYTLLGNQGLLYRYLMYVLEEHHGIYSFHANALYNPDRNELTVVFGGAASGKSPVLMAGLCKGMRVFGTELVHFTVRDGDLCFLRSSCLDNIRPQAIHDDFPELLSRLEVPPREGFRSPSSKFLLDMRRFAADRPVVRNPRLRMLVPHVEMGRHPVIRSTETDRGTVAKMLFDNLSEKIASSYTMYNCMAANGFDSPSRASRRFAAVQTLLDKSGLNAVEIFLAPARHFLEVL